MRLGLIFCSVLVLFSCSKEDEVITPPAPNKYTLTITAEAGGTVSSPGGTYKEGSKITITATPDGQYLFEKWSDGSTINPREITVTANLTLSATFIKKTYPLSVTVEGEGTVQEEVIIQGSTSETTYNAGTTVRLTATPNEGWVFAGWSGDVESDALEIEVAIEKGISLRALFSPDPSLLDITRSVIRVPISAYPSIDEHFSAILDNTPNSFVVSLEGSTFLIQAGVASHSGYKSINEVSPSPTLILKKVNNKWVLDSVDQDIYTWGPRNYSVDGNLITIGDANEIGDDMTDWKGDVWRGIIDINGEIEWFRASNDENRSYHHGMATGDINADGLLDIVTGPGFWNIDENRYKMNLWINNGDKTFNWNQDYLVRDFPGGFGLEVANIVGDEVDEIIIGGDSYGIGEPNHIYVYKFDPLEEKYVLHSDNVENNTFWKYGMFKTKISAFDFNNDGVLDLVDYNSDEAEVGFGVWIGEGNGFFSPHFAAVFSESEMNSNEYEVLDVNNDGFLDIVFRPFGYAPGFRIDPTNYFTGSTNGFRLNELIWINDGAGKFGSYKGRPLILDKDVEGETFHPHKAIPYLEDGILHFALIEKEYRIIGDSVEFVVFDVAVELE